MKPRARPRIERRIAQALSLLQELGLPAEQHNDRTAICLLALLNLRSAEPWSDAQNPRLGIRAILDFARQHLGRDYAENTRESVRKYSVKQLVAAGLVLHNPDQPDRPVNSSGNCYQISEEALRLLRLFGSTEWSDALADFQSQQVSLTQRYAKAREVNRVALVLQDGQTVHLSPGAHSELIRNVVAEFGPVFVPGAQLVYVGDTGTKWGYFDARLLKSLGIELAQHGKMPDVVLFDRGRNWLIVVEAVTSSGPVDGGRHAELAALFQNARVGLVYVTAFPDRGEIFRRFLSVVAWETEVWCASDPTHMIHFNGVRFLGPYPKAV